MLPVRIELKDESGDTPLNINELQAVLKVVALLCKHLKWKQQLWLMVLSERRVLTQSDHCVLSIAAQNVRKYDALSPRRR